MNESFETTQLHVTCIGDSTIDNRVWVDGLAMSYIKSRVGIRREEPAKRVEQYNNSWFKPALSVVENLMAIMPNYVFHDHTNDGFTTTDVLKGNLRDKVFPTGAFLSFPHEDFHPLVEGAKDIQRSQFVILSIGGNNFREFLMRANGLQVESRKNYIKHHIKDVFAKIRNEYVEIVKSIHTINPQTKIILMTQYYPSATQNKYKIYEFMHEIGEILDLGGPSHDPMVVIHHMMKMTYTEAFAELAKEKIENILVADITSSINPYDSNNHVSQIEPSAIGGQKIAKMLKQIITDKTIKTGNAYRFLPSFFEGASHDQKNPEMVATPLEKWVPLSPFVLREGSNMAVTEKDFSLLIHLHKLSIRDKDKVSTSIFKLLNTKNRFEILMERIKSVVEAYSRSGSNEEKIDVLTKCISFIKNKGFLSIYTMETPGFQTPYQTQLDRLEKLLEILPEDEQASFLTELYTRYQKYLQQEKSYSESEVIDFAPIK